MTIKRGSPKPPANAASGSSVVTSTSTFPRNAGNGTSSMTTPAAAVAPVFCTSIVKVMGVVSFAGATVGVTVLANSSPASGWNGQLRKPLLKLLGVVEVAGKKSDCARSAALEITPFAISVCAGKAK